MTDPNGYGPVGPENPALVAALGYAARGWPVLPVHTPTADGACSCGNSSCQSPGKHPRTPHGLKDATTDEATIRRWWVICPHANVAVATGACSGIIALDVDPRNGGDATLQRLESKHGALAHTVQALTGGGGWHFLFQHPGGHIKSRTIAPGLDIKADGGYILVEPSLHASGKTYSWEASSRPDESPLAELPAWLRDMVRQPIAIKPPQHAPIATGQRNSSLASLAGSMRRRGMSAEAILVALQAENDARCSPPLSQAEVERIARSIASYPIGDADEPWQAPIPLFEGPAPMAFPIEVAFPPALAEIREFLSGLATELQVPIDVAAMLLLAVSAASLAQKFVIEARPGWREIAAIWVLCLLESGERKSAAFRRMTDPILEWEQDQAELLAPDIAAATEERQILEVKIKEERNKAGRGKAGAKEEAVRLARELEATKELHPPALVTTDATSEALVAMMIANAERALVASPEADALDVMMGRYDDKARPNLGVWLKGYSGDRVRVHRRGRQAEYLNHPALSVALTVQPEAVRGLFGSRMARGRGLLARFFPSVPAGKVGGRRIGAPQVPDELEMTYIASIRRLLDIPIELAMGPRIVRLDAQAAILMTEFETWVEKELARGGALGAQREWGAKLCGGILRIALVLHCLEAHGRATGRPSSSALEVNAPTMGAALAWAPYLIEHERIASGIAGCSPQRVVADRILCWLERKQRDTFSRRDCFTECRGGFLSEADQLDQPLALLVELGYIRRGAQGPSGTRGGRAPSPLFHVNPLWIAGALK